MLDATLPADWRDGKLYQTLVDWESGPEAQRLQETYTFPPGAEFRRSALAGPFVPLRTATDYTAPIASVPAAGSVRVDGWLRRGAGYLVSWPPAPTAATDCLVAEGEVSAGHVTVGLVRDNHWVAQVPISANGPFRVVIQAPEAGSYGVVIASNGRGLVHDRVTVHRIGWIHVDESAQ